MITLMMVLIAFAGVHFVLQAIVLPSARWEIRLRLFKLRDELRRLKIESRDDVSDEAFLELQNRINSVIQMLPWLDLIDIIHSDSRFKESSELQKRINKRTAILDACLSDEFRRIRREASFLCVTATFWNSSGWLIYLVPLGVALALLNGIKVRLDALTAVPEHERIKVAPAPA